jgi:hypothetical protein
MVGSAAAVAALRRCDDVTTHVRCAAGLEPDVPSAPGGGQSTQVSPPLR